MTDQEGEVETVTKRRLELIDKMIDRNLVEHTIEDNNELEDGPIGFLRCNSTRGHHRDRADTVIRTDALGENG